MKSPHRKLGKSQLRSKEDCIARKTQLGNKAFDCSKPKAIPRLLNESNKKLVAKAVASKNMTGKGDLFPTCTDLGAAKLNH